MSVSDRDTARAIRQVQGVDATAHAAAEGIDAADARTLSVSERVLLVAFSDEELREVLLDE